MKILVFLDFFTPAYKAGGPIRIFESLAGCANTDDQVGIVTQNTDWGDPTPLDVKENSWHIFKKARAIYLAPPNRKSGAILSLIREFRADAVHLNSVFSRTWTMKILFLRRVGKVPQTVFISPHGELADSALNIKSGRKQVFLFFGKYLGLFRHLKWIATSKKEVEEIQRRIGPKSQVFIVPPPLPEPIPHSKSPKIKGKIRIIFFARLSAMKNISFVFENLPRVNGQVEFDIFGPVDPEFQIAWQEITKSWQKLPLNIKCTYHGPISSNEAMSTMSKYDLFIQPSLSENFGYSIVEALASGTPVLISDRTPWNEVTSLKIGHALSLGDSSAWIKALQEFIDMDEVEWRKWSDRTQSWILSKNQTSANMLTVYSKGSLT